jgi:hypothetical protein
VKIHPIIVKVLWKRKLLWLLHQHNVNIIEDAHSRNAKMEKNWAEK